MRQGVQIKQVLYGMMGMGFVLLFFPQALWAQSLPNVAPGYVVPSEKEQYVPEEDRPNRQREIRSDVMEEADIELPRSQEGPVAEDATRFFLRDVRVEGNTRLSAQEIEAQVAPYENREVTLTELNQLVDALASQYQQQGYMTTQVYLPPQEIAQGQVTIQVVEGTVGDVSIAGNRFYKAWVLHRDLGEPSGRVLNIYELEKTMNRLNHRGNYQLKAALGPGDEVGETDIRFNVSERQPWQLAPTFDNQGRPFIGMYHWGTELSNDNLLGLGDRLSARWLGADGTQSAMVSYFLPLNRYGTELGYTYGYSAVDIDLGLRSQPEIQGVAHNYSAILTQPLDLDRVWTLDASFNARRAFTEFDTNRVGLDEVRALTLGLNYNKWDRWGRTFVRAQTSLAPHWLGANRQFWSNAGFLTRLQRLPKDNLLIIRAMGQVTPDTLPGIEQFQIGGAFSVRGYTEGLLVGDRGYSLSIEHRWPIPFLRRVSPWLADRVQGASFFDMGQVWLDRTNPNFIPGLSNKRERTLLMGAGVGIRARLTRFLIGFVDFGFGLVNREMVEPLAQPTARVHFGVRSNLLPEDFLQRGDRITVFQEDGDKQVKHLDEPDLSESEKLSGK